jgi:cell division transport system ATP-binding protein
VIRFEHATYRIDDRTILSDVNLNIQRGEFVFVFGASGAGKSTLLRLIHMEMFPDEGKVTVADHDSDEIRPREIPHFRRKVGKVFQDFQLLEDRCVYDNVAFALWATGMRKRQIPKRVYQVLAETGLSHKRYAEIRELSGGEQQRVAVARALANEPFVLLADEPTGNLDQQNANGVMELLRRINRMGMTVLMATHREDLMNFPARAIRIVNGRVTE